MQFSDGSKKRIIVFEEVHSSPSGQVEIATMMNRLYEDYNLRQIALEGYFTDSPKLDYSWLPEFPPFLAKQPIREREDVIVQQLQDGEISSGEMMAAIYSDIVITGVENESEYSYDPPDSAWNAPIFYLYQIAAPGMTNDEVDKANGLISDKKILEALEFIISTDEWTNQEYAKINDDKTIISAEGWLSILDEIEAKAAGMDISDDDKKAMADLRKFYDTASQRTETMVKNTLAIDSDAPIAMVIGAAHTELVVKQLKEQGVSFAVVRGSSLANNLNKGDLTWAQYNRKTANQSIDLPGTLGAILDGRKKPQPVSNKLWFHSKTDVYIAVDMIARAVASGKKPPFDDIDAKFTNIKISPIEVKGNNVIFSVTAPDDNGKDITIWIRARANPNAVKQLLSDRLKSAHDDIDRKDIPDNTLDETQSTKTKLIPISSATIAEFSTDEAEIKNSGDI